MNFVEFCENRFQEIKLQSDTRQDMNKFDVWSDSEIKAVHELLTSYRTWVKWILYPKCLWDYILVKLKLQKAPEPVLVNRAKKQKEEEDLAKKVASDILNNKDSSNVTPIQPGAPVSEKKDA